MFFMEEDGASLNEDILAAQIDALCPEWVGAAAIAIGVSGGPDSMALCALLSELYERGRAPSLHAITIDHALRPDSADEAVQVGRILSAMKGVTHHIIRRDNPQKNARVMESARHDRYALMKDICRDLGCAHLFIAHHRDDQAETLLFRLAKGSGVDGLAGMAAMVRGADDDVAILRPLLPFPKAALVAYCEAHDIPFINDPSNANTQFARPRLRQARDVLAGEGLSDDRLARTALRIGRARHALEFYAAHLWDEALVEAGSDVRTFDFSRIKAAPPEMFVRILSRALSEIGGAAGDYGPRMERVERLCAKITGDSPFTGATLSGCRIALKKSGTLLLVEKEGKKA